MRFLHYNYKIMKIGCLLPLESDANMLTKICFYLFRALTLFFILWTLIITVYYYLYVDQSFDQFLLLINDMVFIGVTIRLVLYYTNDKTTLELINSINAKFKYSSETGLEERSIYAYVNMVNFVSICWGISSFFAANLYMAFPIFIGKEPMALWYPYNSSISPYFEMSHAFQFFSQNAMWYNYNMLDIFYICVVVITAGQFSILSWELENVCFSSLLSGGFSQEVILQFKRRLATSNQIAEEENFADIYDFMLTNEYVKQFRMKMVTVVDYHRDILDFCQKLEDFLSRTMLFMFLSILSHCVLILYGTSLSTSTIHRLQMAMYFMSAVVESFLIAFPSDFLIQQSSKLQFALYSTPWYLCSNKLGAIWKFWHFRLKTEFGLTIGNFSLFDINAYSWVMKTSFSYFTVLSQTDNKNN